MIGLFRSSIRGSSVAGVTSAAVVQSLFFTAVSVVIVICTAISARARSRRGRRPTRRAASSPRTPPDPTRRPGGARGALRAWPRLKPKIEGQWRKAKQGAAIFSDWRRYMREVALPSAVSYCFRIGVNVVFMAAFGIPITVFTIFLIASSHMLSGIFAITPGGVGQTQALDVATLRSLAPTGSVAAFSITQDSILAVWNVLLGLTLMLWVFGFSEVKALLSRKPAEQPDGRAGAEAPKA